MKRTLLLLRGRCLFVVKTFKQLSRTMPIPKRHVELGTPTQPLGIPIARHMRITMPLKQDPLWYLAASAAVSVSGILRFTRCL